MSACQQPLLSVLMRRLSTSDSPHLKSVMAEVIARLDPVLLLPSMLQELTPATTFILCCAFAYYTSLNQARSAERVEERRLLFGFNPQLIQAALHHSSGQAGGHPLTTSNPSTLIPDLVSVFLHFLLNPPPPSSHSLSAVSGESSLGRLRNGVVDTLSNVLVASASYHLADSSSPSLLDECLRPFGCAGEGTEERKEEESKEQPSSSSTRFPLPRRAPSTLLPLSVRVSLLHCVAYTVSRLGQLRLQHGKDEGKQSTAPDVEWLEGMLEVFTTTCAQSLVPFFDLSSDGEEQSLLLRILFTVAYQRPHLAQQHAPALLQIVRKVLMGSSAHPQVQEVVGEEEGEVGVADVEVQLGGLKLLGCLLAHAADCLVAGDEPTVLFELRAALHSVVKTQPVERENARLASQLLQLSGMG